MARWRLQTAHYLNTDPATEYTYTEVSRETGRQHRQTVKVPRLLEPKDPADCNYPDEIIVCDGNNPQRHDIIFVGPPTPDMEPLDDEAKKITKSYIDSGQWKKPEEGEIYGENLVKEFIRQIDRLQPQPPSASGGVDAKAFSELQAQVKALVEQNAKLHARLGERRRV